MKKISPKATYSFLGIMVLIIIIAIYTNQTSAAKKTAQPLPIVKTTFTKQAEQFSTLEISGFVRGENRADIAPAASGKILNIFKQEGAQVKKGEVLAIIEANQSDAQIAAANTNIAALKKTLTETENYYDQLVEQTKESGSDSATEEAVKSAKRGRDLQIQGVKTQIAAAEGALSMARSGKDNFTLSAPFSGVITAIHAREGGFANFSAPLISMHTQNKLEVETYVNATDGRKITNGAVAIFQTPSGLPISGSVTTVASAADQASLKTLVRIQFEVQNQAIALGDFIKGQIILPGENPNIAIPKNAIISRGGDQLVFVLDENNIARQQAVKVGKEVNGLLDVLEGLNLNQKIVIEGQQYLIDGIATTPYETN